MSYLNTKVGEVNSNPTVIYDAMAIVLSVPFEKTWEFLFQTLVKALRTQETEETVFIFDNYSNNQDFFLKQRKRINRVTNGRYYISTYVKKKVKPINNTLKTQIIKLNSLTDFAKYIQQDDKHSKRKGNVLFNSRDITYRMNSRELKTLFNLTMKRLIQRLSVTASVLINYA